MRALVFFGCLFCSGCFVTPAEAPAWVSVRLNLQSPVHKSSDLAMTALHVQIAVEAEDLESPAAASWSGDWQEAVSLSVQVPAGDNRALSVVVFSSDGTAVDTYSAYMPVLTLSPGDQTVEATLTLSAVFEARLQFVDWPEGATGVVVEDIATGVLFPAVAVTTEGGEVGAVIPGLPVGRFFYLRILDGDGALSEPHRYCPLMYGQVGFLQKVVNIADESC